MKKMILYIIFIFFIGFSFAACDINDSSVHSNSSLTIDITTYCVDESIDGAIETYHLLESGDTIVKDENNTIVEVYHQDNNNKYVCLVNGSAHILREE